MLNVTTSEGCRRVPAAALAFAGLWLAILGPAHAATPADLDRNGVLILVRSTLLALDQADRTGNYTVLRDLGAPDFSAANSAARLGDVFAQERRDGMDLSGVAVLDPQLTLLPQIEANGLLHMSGFFPSVPKQVNFDLAYAAVNRQWRLYQISVNVGPSGPVAPSPPPPVPAPAKPVKPKPRVHAKHEVKPTDPKPDEPKPAGTNPADPTPADPKPEAQ